VTLFVVVAAAVVSLAYRARVAFLLGLERQRTRIAMDLHDEMGSGLGSIGILSGLLSGEADEAPHRHALATQIAEISQELGTALSDIVWSLDPRSSTLGEVAGRLAEHGRRLFSGDAVRFTVSFPEVWPAAPLDFPLRRGLLLIGLEALHNAARHARARHVTLAVLRSNHGWQLVVEDDGCGLPDGARRGTRVGVGLQSLRRRAAEIGGRIEWSDRAGGGTRVTLDFSASGRAVRPGAN
jgi:signal transduction histidine kinase